ncbi:MAG: hypothetical protein JO254_14515 [Pseudolabrys sp.]|nr:hypothetical protein [Pseudolabrys sp.]
MKKLVVMAAAAALLSGISFANAQTAAGTAKMNGDKTQMNAGTNAAFCLDVQGSKKCTFASMADCQKEAKANGTCAPNANKGMTSGSGSAMGASPMGQEKSNPGVTKPANSTENKGAAGKGN